jgi:thiol-disulfide isomerase/thioredoxin
LQNRSSPLVSISTVVFFLFCLCWQSLGFAKEITFETKSGEILNIEKYPAKGSQAIIWTPSGFGVQRPQKVIAKGLAKQNIEVWIADLHSSYFLSRGRKSVESFPATDISQLIDFAFQQGKTEIYLMSTGRGAIAALRAARYWQEKHPGNKNLRGLVLFHPSMYANRPAIGENASYMPIAYASNLPIFIIQPQLSTTYTRLPNLLNVLREGGSQVFVQSLPNVKDGFHMRPASHLGKDDISAKKQLASFITRAIKMIGVVPLQGIPAPLKKTVKKKPDTRPGLKDYKGKLKYPTIDLKNMRGVRKKLADLKGKIVLVSFWASWCPPCIREIPSMNKLYADMDKKKFEILAVNVGENKTAIKKFLKRHKIDFPVLLDTEKKFYLDWKVYVVPSNYLIDKNGKLIAGSVGAIDWQSKEVFTKIKALMK